MVHFQVMVQLEEVASARRFRVAVVVEVVVVG
jgi:hypothetical protein